MRKEVIFTGPKGRKIAGFEWPGEKPTIVFAHGYGADKESWQEWPAVLANEGFRVITFDFPQPHELTNNIGILKAVLSKIKGKFGLVGYSLGGTVAINVAAKNKNAACLVTFVTPHNTGLDKGRHKTLEKARMVKCPWLMLYAGADTLVPLRQGKQLFDAANKPKKFVTLDGVDHDLDVETANQGLVEMVKWFNKHLGGKNG